MLGKMQIWVIFLFELKMGHKAVEITHTYNAFGPGTSNECTVQWWFKKFCKGNENPEDEECGHQPSEPDNDQLRAVIEADALATTWEVVEELKVDHSLVIWHLKQIGKVKKLDKWMPHELTKNQKHHHSEVSSLILFNNNEPFLYQIVMCNEKWIVYNNQWWPAQWLDLEEAPKNFPKQNLLQRKVIVTIWCVWSITAFWIPAKSLYLRSMLSKSMRRTENCNACSQHRSTERAQFFFMTMHNCTLHSQCFRSWTNWATKFAFFCRGHLTSRQLTTTSSSISTTFCRENTSTTNRMQKVLSKSSLNPETWIFVLSE